MVSNKKKEEKKREECEQKNADMSGGVLAENEGVLYSRVKESHLSPAACLPLGASSTSTAPLLAGFGGQVLAVFLQDSTA